MLLQEFTLGISTSLVAGAGLLSLQLSAPVLDVPLDERMEKPRAYLSIFSRDYTGT